MAMQSPSIPVVVSIGTHTWSPDDDKVDGIVAVMRKNNLKHLDTARIYGAGAAETAIGNRKLAGEFVVDTKADTAIVPGNGRFIRNFAKESLQALQTDKVRTYFLHGPDETVPFAKQLESIQELYLEGRFEKFGLSNFSRDQVLEIYDIAKSKGYILPTVYQTNYSLAVRGTEVDLFPKLRELQFTFQSYSPMAGGLLAKTSDYIKQGEGAWDPSTPTGKFNRAQFYKSSYMEMLDRFGQLSRSTGISRAGLAYRWVRYHSVLKGDLGDEMIIGGTSVLQVEEALAELAKGPLDPAVAKEIDELWDLVKHDAPRDNLNAMRKVFRPIFKPYGLQE